MSDFLGPKPLTVAGLDTAAAAKIGTPGSAMATALSATYATKGELADLPTGGATLTVTDAVGEYAWNSPTALYRESPAPRTYFGATSATGELLACYLEHSTGKVRRAVIGQSSVVDDHHVPAASVPEGMPQVWTWNNHNRDSIISYRVGDRTGDLDTLGPVKTLNAGGSVSYSHLIRNPSNPLDIWMLARTWPTSSPYDWAIWKGTINEAAKTITWGARKTFIQFATEPTTVQGYVTVAPVMLGTDYGFRFAVTGNPTNGELHTVHYGTVNLVTGEIASPGKTITKNVVTGSGLPLVVADLDTAYTPPGTNTTRLFSLRDGDTPAVAVATWDPAVTNSPIEYFHVHRREASTGTGLSMPATGDYAQITTPSSLRTAEEFSLRIAITPSATLASKGLARIYGTDGNQMFQLSFLSGGNLRMVGYPTGLAATSVTADSSVAVTYTVGEKIHIRMDASAVTDTVVFYTSTDGTTWTQLGTSRPWVMSGIFDSTLPLSIGNATAGFTGTVEYVKVQSIDGTTTHIDQNFKTSGQGTTSLFGNATVTPDVVAGWVEESLGLAGTPFGLGTTSRYVGGIAYPTPSKGDLAYVARESGGTWTLEKWTKASGSWQSRVLDSSTTHKLARPMQITNQGPLETIYSAFTDYAGFTDFEGDYRAV